MVSLVILMMPNISAESNRNQNPNDVMDIPTQSRIVDLGNGMMRYDHVHYAKDSGVFVDEALEDGYLLMGVQWNNAEPFVVNPFRSGLNEDEVLTIIGNSLNTWDEQTDKEIFGDVNTDYTVSRAKYDEKNSVTFRPLRRGVIAVAYTWWYTGTTQIVESDVMFSTRFAWSASDHSVADKMDLQNIATHEFGHSAGLLDIYDESQNYLTMYGYSYPGDIEKRDLAQGDIGGIQHIYGPLTPP